MSEQRKCDRKTLPRRLIILTRTTIVQHEIRKTTIMKMVIRKQVLPTITSPGPSLPPGQLTFVFPHPVSKRYNSVFQ